MAYTPTLAVGVWVGFDDGASLGLPGSGLALPITARFLVDAVGREGRSGAYGARGFEAPRGLELGRVPLATGGFSGCRSEIFLTGTVPASHCSRFDRFGRGRQSGSRAWDREASRLQELLRQLSERDARIESQRRLIRRPAPPGSATGRASSRYLGPGPIRSRDHAFSGDFRDTFRIEQ